MDSELPQWRHIKWCKRTFFGVEKLKLILAQKDCIGVRLYYAKDDTGKPALVLVGVDKNENDLYNGVILDRSVALPFLLR